MAKQVKLTRKARKQVLEELLAQNINHAFLTYVRIGEMRIWGVRTSKQLRFSEGIAGRHLVEHLAACKCNRILTSVR